MTIDINELRKDKRPQSSTVVHALLDRLEAAEKERDFAKTEIARLHDDIRELTDVRVLDEEDRGRIVAWRQGTATKPAPNAVAYLDLGVGGYMDIGTDLTVEELATLPKGRHMLGIVGTYGVEGYVPAQPAPSVPDAWKLVPIEPTEAMVTAFAELFNVRDQKNTFGPAFRAALAAAPEASK